MDRQTIRGIEAKAARVKLPLNEMAILRWCVIGGAVAGGIGFVVLWANGTLKDDGPNAPLGEIGQGMIFGAMGGACLAVAVASLIKAAVFVAHKIHDARNPSAAIKDNGDG